MKRFSIKKYIIMLAAGFLLLAVDADINTNISYPEEYDNSDSVTGEFQYYTIHSTYGATCTYKLMDSGSENSSAAYDTTGNTSSTGQNVKVIDEVFFDGIHIDLFNDVLGFILIIVACMGLKKVNGRFRLSAVCGVCGLILSCLMSILPFIVNGLLLCNITLIMGIFYLADILLTIFLFVGGLFKMCPQVCCRDERKWCQICWFISFVLQIMTTFIFWLGADFGMLYTLGLIFQVILAAVIIGFWIILYRTIDYLQASYDEAAKNKLITEK